MHVVVLFDRDAAVAELITQALERSSSRDPIVANDKEEVLLALTCRSDVTAAVVDATSLSEGEIDDFCVELDQARRPTVTVVLIAQPDPPTHTNCSNVVRLSKPLDSQLLLKAVGAGA